MVSCQGAKTMAGPRRVRREAIVEAASRIVAEQGAAAMTFQALAAVLGVSKQAIIYWYPSKWELVRDVCLPAMRAEADITVAAIEPAASAAEAIDLFVRALVGHYIGRLAQFR